MKSLQEQRKQSKTIAKISLVLSELYITLLHTFCKGISPYKAPVLMCVVS